MLSLPRDGVQSLAGEPRSHKPGFPGGSVVKNLPANAGDMGSTWEDPTRRGQLGPCVTTAEPVL